MADNQSLGCRAMAAANYVTGNDDLRAMDDDKLADRMAGFLGDSERRRQTAARARKMVDGLGAGRVLTAVEKYLSGPITRLEASA